MGFAEAEDLWDNVESGRKVVDIEVGVLADNKLVVRIGGSSEGNKLAVHKKDREASVAEVLCLSVAVAAAGEVAVSPVFRAEKGVSLVR